MRTRRAKDALALGLSLLGLWGIALWPALTWAHKEDYLDETFVYETIPKGVFSLEWRTRYTRPRFENGANTFWVNSPFLEYGITDHLMAEARLSLGNEEGDDCLCLATPLWLLDRRDLPDLGVGNTSLTLDGQGLPGWLTATALTISLPRLLVAPCFPLDGACGNALRLRWRHVSWRACRFAGGG